MSTNLNTHQIKVEGDWTNILTFMCHFLSLDGIVLNGGELW